MELAWVELFSSDKGLHWYLLTASLCWVTNCTDQISDSQWGFGKFGICAIPHTGIFLKDIEMGKGILHWPKSIAVVEQKGPLGIPLTRMIKKTGRHLLGTFATPLPPPFLLGHETRSQEGTEGGRTSVATNSLCRGSHSRCLLRTGTTGSMWPCL